MFTVLLAWINIKYKWDYDFLFVGTFIIDVSLIQMLEKIF